MNQTPQEIQAQIDVLNAQIALTAKQRAKRVFDDANQDARNQSQLTALHEALAKAQQS